MQKMRLVGKFGRGGGHGGQSGKSWGKEGSAYEHRHTCIYRVRMGMGTYDSKGFSMRY